MLGFPRRRRLRLLTELIFSAGSARGAGWITSLGASTARPVCQRWWRDHPRSRVDDVGSPAATLFLWKPHLTDRHEGEDPSDLQSLLKLPVCVKEAAHTHARARVCEGPASLTLSSAALMPSL